MPVFPGIPVITFRVSPGFKSGLIHVTSSGSGETSVSTSSLSKGWSKSQ